MGTLFAIWTNSHTSLHDDSLGSRPRKRDRRPGAGQRASGDTDGDDLRRVRVGVNDPDSSEPARLEWEGRRAGGGLATTGSELDTGIGIDPEVRIGNGAVRAAVR